MRWGSRALTKTAYHFSGSRPQLLLIPNLLRPLSTASTQAASTASPRAALALALGGAFLGLSGYYIGVRSNSVGVDGTTARAVGSPYPSPLPPRPPYGTTEDFSRTIEELRASFAAEAVTTARDQLEAHGFSPNAHHPGMACPSFLSRAMPALTVLRAPT